MAKQKQSVSVYVKNYLNGLEHLYTFDTDMSLKLIKQRASEHYGIDTRFIKVIINK